MPDEPPPGTPPLRAAPPPLVARPDHQRLLPRHPRLGLDAEAESLGYATELEEYAAKHPRPTLKGFMLAHADPTATTRPPRPRDQYDAEEGQTDDAAA